MVTYTLTLMACDIEDGLCSNQYLASIGARRLNPNVDADAGGFEVYASTVLSLAELEGGIAIGGARAASRYLAACRNNSFVQGTKVLMTDGSYKPIEQVKVGEQVLATDPVTGETGARTVIATILGEGFKQMVDITIDTDGYAGNATGFITATAGHPFWMANGSRWVNAGDLEEGVQFRTDRGGRVAVLAVRNYARHRQVYNLHVDEAHTYYVLGGRASVLVHNQNDTDPINFGRRFHWMC